VADVADFLLEPWRNGITTRAMLEVILIAIAAGPLGCWVVLYGLSYSAESLAHALFPGLVIAALGGAPLELGALAGIAVAAPAIALAARLPGIDADTGIAVAVTSLLGLGALLALAPETPRNVQELLFGNVLAISDAELLLAGALAFVVPAALWLAHQRLLLVGFDRASARAFGTSAHIADLIMLVLVGAFTVVAVQALGNLLILALLVGPAAAARLVTQRIVPMMALATALAVLSGLAGIYVSFHADTAAGASIAACVVVLYVVVSALEPRRMARLEPARRAAGELPA
jgi:ABC-type Mn2+/Zn2+ transport system permease subunit